jgi:hypothetical protein
MVIILRHDLPSATTALPNVPVSTRSREIADVHWRSSKEIDVEVAESYACYFAKSSYDFPLGIFRRDIFRLPSAKSFRNFYLLLKQLGKSLPGVLQKIRGTSLQSYVFPSLSRVYTSRRIYTRARSLFFSLSCLLKDKDITHLCCCWNFQSFV